MNGTKIHLENTREKESKNHEDAEELKQLKAKIAENEKKIQKIYREIGVQYFGQNSGKFVSELQELIDEITVNIEKEKELISQKNALYGKKECLFCGTVNEKEAEYCMECGTPLGH